MSWKRPHATVQTSGADPGSHMDVLPLILTIGRWSSAGGAAPSGFSVAGVSAGARWALYLWGYLGSRSARVWRKPRNRPKEAGMALTATHLAIVHGVPDAYTSPQTNLRGGTGYAT
jgi:hypothetical protein